MTRRIIARKELPRQRNGNEAIINDAIDDVQFHAEVINFAFNRLDAAITAAKLGDNCHLHVEQMRARLDYIDSEAQRASGLYQPEDSA